MKNIVLITAKGGNTTIKNKNLIEVEGKTFLGWQLSAAKEAMLIDEVFVSTECPFIKAEAKKYSAHIIDRPDDLAQAFTNHGDAILHGVREARKKLNEEINLVVILLGNTAMNTGGDIDYTINILNQNNAADSCMTVWKAQDDHPYRAMKINNGYLESFLDAKNTDTNRQAYPDVYFYDQGPWTVRYSVLLNSKRGEGPACWWWMGNNVVPVIRNWVTGKDVHTQLDVEIARTWLKNGLHGL
jgi:N-acylneuraminate cytidylyltransferase